MPPRPLAYAFGPFRIQSELELPELSLAGPEGVLVHLRAGPVPDILPDASFAGVYCSASPSQYLLYLPDIARYHVKDGCSITVQPDPKATPADIRAYLLSSVFMVLCHQRQLLPLHASAVEIGSGVVAFLGASGAGKSTLAAYFNQAGHRIVADDICLLDPQAGYAHRVYPFIPWLKLWRNSLEALGQGTEGLLQTFSDEDKYRLPAERLSVSQARQLPLRAVVILERNDQPSSPPTMRRLTPLEAITRTMEFTYQEYLLNLLNLKKEHFTRCGEALRGVDAYLCERSFDFASFPAVIACIRDRLELPS